MDIGSIIATLELQDLFSPALLSMATALDKAKAQTEAWALAAAESASKVYAAQTATLAATTAATAYADEMARLSVASREAATTQDIVSAAVKRAAIDFKATQSSFNSLLSQLENYNRMRSSMQAGSGNSAASQYAADINKIVAASKIGAVAQADLAKASQLAGERFQDATLGAKKLTVADEEASAASKEMDASLSRAGGSGGGGYTVERMLERLAIRVTVLAAAYKTFSTIRDSVTEAIDVTRQLALIENVTNAGAKGVDDLRASFGRFAAEAGKGPTEVSKGFYLIASATSSASDNMGILDQAAKLSAVGLGDTAVIAKALTGAINAYGKENLSAAQAAGTLFEGVKQGGAEASEFAGVIGRVIPIARLLGVSFNDVMASLATFTKLGVGADEAATGLRQALTNLLSDSSKKESALNSIGMSMAGLRAEIKDKGLAEAFIHLTTAAQGNEETIKAIVPNIRAFTEVMGTAGSQAETLTAVQKAMANGQQDLATAVENNSKKSSFAVDQISARWELFKQQLGEEIVPAVLAAGKSLNETLDPGVAANFGRTIADIVKLVSPLVGILDTLAHNTWAVEAAFTAWLGPKILGMIGAVIAQLETLAAQEVAVAGTTIALADSAFIPMSSSLTALLGPIALLATAFVALRALIAQWAAESERDIASVVADANKAGEKFQNLLKGRREANFVKTGQSGPMEQQAFSTEDIAAATVDLEKQRAAVVGLSLEHDKLTKKLDNELEIQKNGSEAASNAAGRQIIKIQEQIDLNNEQLAQAKQALSSDRATVEFGNQAAAAYTKVGKAIAEIPSPPPPPSKQEKEYAQRVEETKAKIQAAVDEANARLGVEKQVYAAIVGGNNAEAEAIARNAERQAEINKLVVAYVNSLTDATHPKLDPALLNWLKAQAAAIVDAGKADDALKEKEKFITDARKEQIRLAEIRKKQRDEEEKQEEAIRQKIRDQIDEQNHQLDITKQAIGEALSGGNANAADVVKLADKYYKEIGDHTERGANNAHRMAVETAQVAAEQEKYDALLKIAVDAMQPMWKTYLQMGMDAINAVSSNLAKGLADAMTTGTVDIKDIWKSLVGDLASIFANFLADLVKRWLEAELAKTAITASQAAIRQALDSGSSGTGQGGGSMGSTSSSGMYSMGTQAYHYYQGAGGSSGLAANTAGTGAGGGYSAAGGTGYTLGVAAIWVAAIFTFLNYISTHIEKMGSGAVGLTGSPIAGQFTYTQGAMGGGTSQHNQGQVDRAGAEIAAQLNAFVDQAAIYAVKTVDIGLKKKGQGGSADWIVYVNGIAEHFGKDIDAAESYAYVQLLKNAELKGLPKEVTDAIHNTAATTADQLNQEITNAYTLFFEKLGEVGAQVYQVSQKYQTQINDQINKVFAQNNYLFNPPAEPIDYGGGQGPRPGAGGADGVGGGDTGRGGGYGAPTPGGYGNTGSPGGGYYKSAAGGGHGGVQDQAAVAATAEMQAVIALVAARNREIQAIRDSLLGLDTSGAKRLQDIASYNAGIAASHDIVQAEIDKINDEIAKLGNDPNATAAVQHLKETLQQYIDELNKAPDQIKGVQLDMAVFDELFKYLPKTAENEKMAAHYAQLKAQLELAALEGQIKVLQAQGLIGNEFDDLLKQAEGFVNDPNNFKPNKDGGHGGATGPTRQDAQQFLKDQAYALAEAGKTALQQQIDNIHKQYAEEEKAAGKDAKLKQQLIAQEAQAVAAAVAAAQADALKQFNDLVGPQDAFTKLRAQYDAMRKTIRDAGFDAAKTAQMMGQLDDAEQKALNVLGSQQLADLFGNIAGMLADGTEKSQILFDQQKLNYALQVAGLRAQLDLLEAQGYLIGQLKDDAEQAYNYIVNHPPVAGGGNPGDGPGFPGAFNGQLDWFNGQMWQWDGTKWVPVETPGSGGGGGTDPRQSALDLLAKYENSNLNKWQQALNELNSDFATIRAQLGNTTEVANAYASALQRIREEFLKGLSDFRDSLTNGQASGASVATQYSSAAANYRKLLAAVQGGDLSQADALQQAAQTYRDLAAQMFGTATGGFASVRDEILRDLNAILGANGMGGAAGSNVIGGPSYFAQAAQLQIAAVNNGTDSVVAAANNITDSLSSRIDSLNNRLDILITTSQSIDRGVEALDQGPPPAAVGYGSGG